MILHLKANQTQLISNLTRLKRADERLEFSQRETRECTDELDAPNIRGQITILKLQHHLRLQPQPEIA